MTVYLVIPLPKLPYIHRIYMVLANSTNTIKPLHYQKEEKVNGDHLI